jgi:hypothetical protein
VNCSGWPFAAAGYVVDSDVTSVLATPAECGFREGTSPTLIQEWWQDVWERWQKCRAKARSRYRER